MAKTDRDVIDQALRLIGVADLSSGSAGEEFAEAKRNFDWLLIALDDIHQMGLGIVSDNIPDWAYIPLAEAVAGMIAEAFSVPQYASLEAAGLQKLRAYAANEVRTNQPAHVEFF